MSVDVLFCSAPVMSVVRPSAALGLLQALLRQNGIGAETLYLNLLFADRIGLDLNERLAEKLPSHLLAGDWLFGDCLGSRPGRPQARRHPSELSAAIERKGLDQLYEIRRNLISSFVADAADRLLERTPKIIGFTSMFEQTAASLAIAAAVKARDPSVVICVGGANCHGPMGAVLLKNFAQIDHVFNGEADTVFGPAVEAILRGEAPRGLSGCLSRDQPAAGAAAGPTAMDALPIPDYADYFAQLPSMSEAARVRPSIPFESSRGCWWGQKHHCTFCGLNGEGMAFRAKSAPRVLSEIETLHAEFGIGRFAATDNILGMSHIDGVLGRLAERPAHGFRFFYEIKANMDEAQLEKAGARGDGLVAARHREPVGSGAASHAQGRERAAQPAPAAQLPRARRRAGLVDPVRISRRAPRRLRRRRQDGPAARTSSAAGRLRPYPARQVQPQFRACRRDRIPQRHSDAGLWRDLRCP
ncbi:RiPP maturation radical SAM C-methyltransferase [Bradyrhizobium liaoningense]|uniref:RiPP maturation radical SAM C-methyltransferase n=1 Tax=Bradyrhizobium liaoningense TaxID=43992 RepID=UPI0020123436|nr:RiPP maturation radical SAM C-methyltransferase [Bradyrhizobium liaoningense]